eukprot:4188395-Pyramimonas_sp.AAC.1
MVVMHFDDIAYNPLNPHQGVVINNPTGQNVYEGVPKEFHVPILSPDERISWYLGRITWLSRITSERVDFHRFWSGRFVPGISLSLLEQNSSMVRYDVHMDAIDAGETNPIQRLASFVSRAES